MRGKRALAVLRLPLVADLRYRPPTTHRRWQACRRVSGRLVILEQELTPECRSIFRQSALLARLGVFIIDLGSGECLYCSEQLARMHGLSVERCRALIGSAAQLERIDPDDRERYRAAMAQGRGAGGRYEIAYRMVDASGTAVAVHEMAEQVTQESGAPRLVGCVQDLSESKRIEATLERRVAERTAELRAAKEAAEAAERAASASIHRFTAAAEALSDGLAIFDADDRLVFHNSRYPGHAPPAFAEVLEIGKRFADMIRASEPMYHPEMGPDFRERRLSGRQEGGAGGGVPHRRRTLGAGARGPGRGRRPGPADQRHHRPAGGDQRARGARAAPAHDRRRGAGGDHDRADQPARDPVRERGRRRDLRLSGRAAAGGAAQRSMSMPAIASGCSRG